MGNSCIINNQCTSSTFNSLSSIFRIGALLANLLLIVNYRKVAKNVKTIAFVLVNWLIFEIIAIVLPAVVYYAANTVFAFSCVCVFVPNAVSMFAMLYSDAEEDDFGESSSIGMSTGNTSNASSNSGTGKNKGTAQNSKGQSQQKTVISNNQSQPSQMSQVRTTENSNNAASEIGSVPAHDVWIISLFFRNFQLNKLLLIDY